MEYVRIDKGLKRGERHNDAVTKRTPGANQYAPIIPKDLSPESVIMRYLADEKVSEIAASYGVSHSAMNRWLMEHAEEIWQRALVARAQTLKEQAEDELEAAPDALSLARARERLRSSQWALERIFHRVYGPKQYVEHSAPVQVQINLGNHTGQPQPIDVEGIATHGEGAAPKDGEGKS